MARSLKRGRPRDKTLATRRRDEILDVAALFFADRGYRSADIQVLADQIGVGKGTIYRYFKTKADLFLKAVDRGMRRLQDDVDAAMMEEEDSLEALANVMRAYLAFFDRHPEFVELLVHERAEFKMRKKPTYFIHRDTNVAKWRKRIRALIAEGRIRHVSPAGITDVIGNLLYGTMFTNHFAGRRTSFKTQSREIIDIAFYGTLSDRERKHRRGR